MILSVILLLVWSMTGLVPTAVQLLCNSVCGGCSCGVKPVSVLGAVCIECCASSVVGLASARQAE